MLTSVPRHPAAPRVPSDSYCTILTFSGHVHGRKYVGYVVDAVREGGEVDHEAHDLPSRDLPLHHQSTTVEQN